MFWVSGLLHLSLKGSDIIAQGNALGNQAGNRFLPCKGKTQHSKPTSVMPFQGDQTLVLTYTQGDALGYLIRALQAQEQATGTA